MDRRQIGSLFIWKLCWLCLLGCRDGDGKQSIRGQVSYQGQPMIRGLIEFEPASKEQPASQTSAVIVDGAFQIPGKHGLWPGEYRVRINSAASPSQGESGVLPGTEPANDAHKKSGNPPIIPAKYNRETTLRATVTADGKNDFRFDLQ